MQERRFGLEQAGTETVLARIKGAKKLPGVEEIMLPGEGGSARMAAVVSAGVVSVEKNLYEGIKTVRTWAKEGYHIAVSKRGCLNGFGSVRNDLLVHPYVNVCMLVENPHSSKRCLRSARVPDGSIVISIFPLRACGFHFDE